MLSDRPGEDAQESAGLSVRLDWHGPASGVLTSITSFADSQIDFSFDADWGNDESWAPVTYDYISLAGRDRQTLSQEIRFVADSWLVGMYALKLSENLERMDEGTYYDPFYDWADSLAYTFGSAFEATSLAAFSQADWRLSARTRLSAGLRVEHRATDYSDTDGQSEDPSETMWGGELSLQHDFSADVMGYASLSRGYKAGGFNLGPVPPGFREFGDEVLWTIETGVKSVLVDNRLQLSVAAFFSQRDDQQVRISEQLNPNDPASFVFFTINDAEGGEASGLEFDLRWYATDALEAYSSLGILRSKLGANGRDLAHAPRYSLAAGTIYRHANGFFARIDATASDKFYFDVSHDQESKSYALVHARLGFENDDWRAYIYGRNLTDEYYAVRGFYFGNEPPDFPATLYTRAGDPRHVGLTIERRFH
jgi:outer membrane receptor protein involved in Fe transport